MKPASIAPRHWLQLTVILALLGSTGGLFAHGFSTSYSRFRVDGSKVHVQLTVGLLEFHSGPKIDLNDDGEVSQDELNATVDALTGALKANFRIQAPNEPAIASLAKAELLNPTSAKIDLLYLFDHDVKELTVTSTLDKITQPDHQHLLVVGAGDDSRQGVLDAKNPSRFIDLDGQTSFEAFSSFLRLGVEHILTGYDHLAFLAGLLIATTTFKSLVKVVTAFTVAHSVTLALAAFSLVTIPSRLVESLIALSIAYVAVENFTGKSLVQRWQITFLFGLVHGFGFANVLREMELTRQHLAMSLFSFNLGVEAGQLLFVGAAFPLVLLAIKSRWKEQVLAATSLVIMALGFYWFVQRAFLT